MKKVNITTGAHPQNGKQVRMITILDHSFVYSDKRGHCCHTTIDGDFAREIISEIPAKHYYPDRLPSPGQEFKLSWNWFGENKGYQLLLHYGSDHVYTSENINI
jgi:hypothetical protein